MSEQPRAHEQRLREGFRADYDAWRFREDTWTRLKVLTTRLARAAKRTEEVSPAHHEEVAQTLSVLSHLGQYFAFPGKRGCRELSDLLQRGYYQSLGQATARMVRLLVSDAYRRRGSNGSIGEDVEAEPGHEAPVDTGAETRPYFEVLVVDDIGPDEEAELRRRMVDMRRPTDEVIYDLVVVPTVEDAVIAVLFNHAIQSCVLRYDFAFRSDNPITELRDYLAVVPPGMMQDGEEEGAANRLAHVLSHLRPELDLFLVTDDPLKAVTDGATDIFRRVFYRQEDYLELHLSILKGIRTRNESPFFNALREYSRKPTGVFHALPISRGKSITNSHWIGDMAEFYGMNVFLAETSATGGGLDSLLQPQGPLKLAQEKAARAFGARRTFFVTNGTSSANKIVMQALVRPGDIVLVSRDCHKSHHYAMVLAGAFPLYMDSYPLQEYSMYGAVPLADIKRHLLALKEEGRLERVRMLLLTNCTFDGIVYDPERVMREVLAIKPDMIFVWDEAWFAFARAVPTYRRRTAMAAVATLHAELRAKGDTTTRLRVYATQSTHKTLTSLRQGSMIHVYDQDFERTASEAFQEAYMMYISTSPNYQILASLDVGRRQMEVEGYELVKKSVELAMILRERIAEHPLLSRYFRVLRPMDVIPEQFRPSGLTDLYTPEAGFSRMERAFQEDELVLDPMRLTLHVGLTGIDGDTFKKMLIDTHDIQVNKTSRNTALFMVNIGTTRGAVAYLLRVLTQITEELAAEEEDEGPMERSARAARVAALTQKQPPLPNFSRFHDGFRPDPDGTTPEGDLRRAFFLAYEEANIRYLPMDGGIDAEIAAGAELVSAAFVTPYPPGFPVLVPGQVISGEILAYLKALDVKEIHGYRPDRGLRIFRPEVLPAPAESAKAKDSAYDKYQKKG